MNWILATFSALSRTRLTSPVIAALIALAGATSQEMTAATAKTLWQIGEADGKNAEFAHAPGHYSDFKADGFFLVGRSDPHRDWPYVHPGPDDTWAGARPHAFTILFTLQSAPAAGQSQLRLHLLDTHQQSPPRLRVTINGNALERRLPPGNGDASVMGAPEKGRQQTLEIPFETKWLRAGENEIVLTTLSGSWLLYDAIVLEAPPELQLGTPAAGTRLLGVSAAPYWLHGQTGPVQPIRVTLRNVGPATEATVSAAGVEITQKVPENETCILEMKVPAAEQATTVALRVVTNGREVAHTNLAIKPPRLRQLWLLPHSHVDIGYTHRQDEVVQVQISNLETALRLARESATNAPGSRFKWNPEAVWTLDHFLQQATPEKREAFLAAVKRGDVGVDALYGNMLTGLCRPEELAQCLAIGARLSSVTGVPLETASICDVPGWTWGLVPVMAQAGVKYFAIGPNYADRVGTIHRWDDQPFYWKSQSGRERVLCWVVEHYVHHGNLEETVLNQIDRLDRKAFAYDTSFLFWVGTGPGGALDNAPPDEQTVAKVLAWNARYAAPKVSIGLARDFFRDFERKHGARVPEFSGDLTPYWEDGAGSTARETAMNRRSADRLSQAGTLFAMLQPRAWPAAAFEEAWKNVLLYSEHTWGAHCSISSPDDPFTVDQWKRKAGFAEEADRASRVLLKAPLPPGRTEAAVDVYNTTQWERTGLAMVPGGLSGESVLDDHGRRVPSQRLASGERVFLAKDVPGFGARRFQLSPRPDSAKAGARAAGNVLENSLLRLELDPTSGAIASLRLAGDRQDYVDSASRLGLNAYQYVLGEDAAGARGNGPVTIRVLENGPLVAALQVESEAPGCNRLIRELRVIEGSDRLEIVNHVDRQSVRQKDAVHFGFAFNVPDGTMRMETPWAVVRPDLDQLPGACRNWFTVQRWVDISNRDRGIAWAPIDAPLMEIGGLTASLLGAVPPDRWLTHAPESQTIYSWAQNNHWHTNYKIDQPGVTTFQYILAPHRGGYSALRAAQFGLETSRPLVVARASDRPIPASLLSPEAGS